MGQDRQHEVTRRAFLIGSTAAGAATAAGVTAAVEPQLARADERPPGAFTLSPDTLLRNGTFQDDWLSLLPRPQTLHWAFPPTLYNRRDFNPDGWRCRGSWEWLAADQPRGARRLVLNAPDAQIVQRIPWIAVHDERVVSGFPDAGGFPELRAQQSDRLDRLVRDLTLRLLVRGDGVPADAGGVEIGFCALGAAVAHDPLGADVKPLAAATATFPTGTFAWQWITARLTASAWRAAVAKTDARLLPAVVSITIRFAARAGSVELGAIELTEPSPATPNLLPNGRFDAAGADGHPARWERPEKYRYFPPRPYYLFNSWHNARFDNRGRVDLDRVIVASGTASLKMIVPSGDEVSIASDLIRLRQREPRLIEVSARVKTDALCMLDIDAVDARGERLDGFRYVHKSPVSIGTDGWRRVRQVFRPRTPVGAFRLKLCARGANGYTLDATGAQPQGNVVGTVWWDDVRVHEPESTSQELQGRGVASVSDDTAVATRPRLTDLDPGERRLGDNVLTARIANPGSAASFALVWTFTSPAGQRAEFKSAPVRIASGGDDTVRLVYALAESCRAYTEFRGHLTLVRDGQPLEATELWFSTWTVPIDLKLGALYLRPEQSQLVRMNLGVTAATLAKIASVRLEIVHRRTGRVVHTMSVPATAAAIAAQRARLPADLRGDLSNLLLADLDVSALPVQPFDDPQRNWLVRATALDARQTVVATVDSPPFCRQAPAPAQTAIGRVTIGRDNLLRIDGRPWMPWGAIYGFAPEYAGPATPAPNTARNLRALPDWSPYDRFSGEHYTRRANDFNCARDVAGRVTPRETIDKRWTDDNRYSSTAFVTPDTVFSMRDLVTHAGGQAALDAYLDFCRRAPMVVAVTPGIEEAFGLFHGATPQQLAGLRDVVEHLRRATDKPVMVGHGGYWNRFEFEKVPYFQIYDPETEPLYPANLHTDLRPLVDGQEKVIWLRPQMYEDVPYERWRFHVYTELMRGCRGWQIAHGPGDASLFRGLHGELTFMQRVVASSDAGPAVKIEPWIEHWSRRHDGKTYLVAATTRGIGFGRWRAGADATGPGGRARLTDAADDGGEPRHGYAAHGIQYLPTARTFPPGARLVQWVRVDSRSAPRGLAVLVKANGRFTHAASWGPFDIAALPRDRTLALWFLRTFYLHSAGFLGWDDKLLSAALPYVPATAVEMGSLPAPGVWTRLEIPLERLRAHGALLDGVGFIHAGGRVEWGRTTITTPAGEMTVWDDTIELPAAQLARVKISVDGLRAGTRVRVLFEDREITAGDGAFVDDFRGSDLYQRFGGGPMGGYGDAPVALHVYEVG